MLRRLKATSKSSKMPPKSTRQDTLTYADVCWRMLNVCWTYADIKKLQDAAKIDKARYADVCWRMLTYSERMLNVCWTYADVCWRMLICWRMQAQRERVVGALLKIAAIVGSPRGAQFKDWRMLTYADVCWRMLTYADGNRWLAERCSVYLLYYSLAQFTCFTTRWLSLLALPLVGSVYLLYYSLARHTRLAARCSVYLLY